MGEARLAPVREMSIPRLELTAEVISVKLSKIIREELDMNFQKVFYWTDSMSVLKCNKNESKRFHTFESNRLTVIHNGSSHSEWHYVNRDNNPADDGSKGLKLDDMLKNDRRLRGPEFLWGNESLWPRMVEIPALKDDDPEVRKETQIYTVVVQSKFLEPLVARYSSWWKLKMAVAWLLRCKAYLLLNVRLSKRSALVASECQVQGGEVPFVKYGYLRGQSFRRSRRKSSRKYSKCLSLKSLRFFHQQKVAMQMVVLKRSLERQERRCISSTHAWRMVC